MAIDTATAASLLGSANRPVAAPRLTVIQGGAEEVTDPLNDLINRLQKAEEALQIKKTGLDQETGVKLRPEQEQISDAKFDLNSGRLALSIIERTERETGTRPNFDDVYAQTNGFALLKVKQETEIQKAKAEAAELQVLNYSVEKAASAIVRILEKQSVDPANKTRTRDGAFIAVVELKGDELLDGAVLAALKGATWEEQIANYKKAVIAKIAEKTPKAEATTPQQ